LRSILICVENLDADILTADLWEGDTKGIIDEGQNVRAFFDDEVDLQPILGMYADVILETRREKAPDLQRFERDGWEGIPVGTHFFVAPTWASCLVPEGRIQLAIDSAVAFGTGRHESTQLAIEALETYLKPGATVFDIGCGSGILSLAARLLGAGQVISCDLDVNAVISARTVLSSPLFLGTAEAMRTASADVVVANISAHVVDGLADELGRIVKPDGLLILAGFIRENPPKRWVPEKLLERGDWLAWICRPQLAPIGAGEPYRPRAEWW
jgi:ribosomal protein L11 methyltransferase